MILLSIETSCDETAAAVLKITKKPKKNFPAIEILSNVVYSQIKIHQKTKGIVPEVAAREHVLKIMPVIDSAIHQARQKIIIRRQKNQFTFIDAVAVTVRPGLLPSLAVGVDTAKAMAFAWNKPVYAINHLEGHIFSAFIERAARKGCNIAFPVLALIVSGGHTKIVLMKKFGSCKTIGQTRDDAVGEAFDKVAKLLKLGYPGGPIISRLAESGEQDIGFPRPMIKEKNFDFSFSGLKTAVLYYVQKINIFRSIVPSIERKKIINNICRSFENAAVDVLTDKVLRAIKKYKPKTCVLAGGVAANKKLRESLKQGVAREFPKLDFLLPAFEFCTDNAVMIGAACVPKLANKKGDQIFDIHPDSQSEF